MRVDWTDAVYCDDVAPEDLPHFMPENGIVVGHLVFVGDEHITVALEGFDDGTNRRFLAMSFGMIRAVTVLRE